MPSKVGVNNGKHTEIGRVGYHSEISNAFPHPWPHLSDPRDKNGLKGYKILQKCLRFQPPGRTSIRQDPKEVPRCSYCKNHQGRLHECLIYAKISYWFPPDKIHACVHAQSNPDHEIAVAVDGTELFCYICKT